MHPTPELGRPSAGEGEACAQVPGYLVLNLADMLLEVHTVPAAVGEPGHRRRESLGPGDAVSLVLGNRPVATSPSATCSRAVDSRRAG